MSESRLFLLPPPDEWARLMAAVNPEDDDGGEE